MDSRNTAVSIAKARPSTIQRILNSETTIAYLFLLPSLIGFTIFFAVPAVRGIFISFTDWDLLTEPNNVGLANYQRLIEDDDFVDSLRVTVAYVLWNIPLQTVLATLIAVMMDRLTKSMIVRSIILLPWLMPNVVVALLWLWMLDPRLGIVNVGISALGFDTIPFLGNPDYAIASIAGINIWRHVGYTALLIFAGLQTIPTSIYEAAEIDGANEFNKFFRITVPLLRPVLVFVLVTSIIGSFQIFDTIAITTQGGPINATEVVNWLIFEQAFERFNMGYATTISIALFFILVIVSLIQLRLLRADEAD